MFYKVATAFACFLVLGQAMADESNPGAANKGVSKGEVSVNDRGPSGPSGAAVSDVGPGKAGDTNPDANKAGGPPPGAESAAGGPPPDANKAGGPNPPGPPNVEPNREGGPGGPNRDVGPGGPGKGAGNRTEIQPIIGTFDQLKLACDDPGLFHFQLPPDNIKIACSSHETRWVPSRDGGLHLDCTRIVDGQLFSSKILVEKEEYAVSVPPNAVSCPTFKEIELIFSSQYATNCEEILGYSDLGAFCESRLSSDPNAVPELVETRDTGRQVDTCAGTNVNPVK